MELIKENVPAPSESEQPAVPQVNDVAPPAQTTPSETPAPADDTDVAPAPTAVDDNKPEAAPETEHNEAPLPQPVKPPKPKKAHGTGAAIFAAVIIILGLGAMFTYAYLKTR